VIKPMTTLEEALSESMWIQENVPESLTIKKAVFHSICASAPAEAVIASSTSSFTWSQLAPFVKNPMRLITAHPFNPPHLMPLVEIFAATEALRREASNFYKSMGRTPVLLSVDAPGHIANRLASALWREAVYIVSAGIADVEAVDAAMVDGPGLRWSAVGPHLAYHLGGGAGGMRDYLQRLGPSQVSRWAALGKPELTDAVKEKLVVGVEREAAGRTVDALAKARDEFLIEVLQLRSKMGRSVVG
jgi:3-hydroxyacyl-CoA dehydrogenase